MFPVINHIDDVIPHIQGNDNFHVNHKSDYIVIDYILNTPDTFHNAVEKECRGILFFKDGRIMARRLHKFFNVNERPETQIENLDFSKPHWILEKLDGSLISLMKTNNEYKWASKAGITFLTPLVENFVNNTNSGLLTFASKLLEMGYTAIFEFCSNKNRIVISHPEDKLILIAIRNNNTGEYVNIYDGNMEKNNLILNLIKKYNIELVKQYPGTVQNMQHLLDITKPMEGIEGFVVAWEDGTRVKIKADHYCLLHKSKDELMHEKNVVAILAEGKADDFRVLLTSEDRAKFEEFELKFWNNVELFSIQFKHDVTNIKALGLTRKEFALNYPHLNGLIRSFIFTHFDDIEVPSIQDVKTYMIDTIKKNTGSQSNVDKVRNLWDSGSLKWIY